jgi:hypothetical protein
MRHRTRSRRLVSSLSIFQFVEARKMVVDQRCVRQRPEARTTTAPKLVSSARAADVELNHRESQGMSRIDTCPGEQYLVGRANIAQGRLAQAPFC